MRATNSLISRSHMTDTTLQTPGGNKIGRRTVIAAVLIAAAVALGAYWYVSARTVYIDLSQVKAPVVSLAAPDSGQLQAVFVQVGETVKKNQPVALVGNDVVKAKTDGEIISVDKNIGEYENAATGQNVVATMIDPTELRVVGTIDEDKGFSAIQVGDIAKFTVDAFGGKTYYGVVDAVGQTSIASITSNIFNQRPTNQFDIYVRFDPTRYPELKNGMSARIWIYTQ